MTAVEPDDRLRAIVVAAGVAAVPDVAALPNDAFQYAYTLNVLEHIDADVDALRTLRAKPCRPVFTSMDAKVGHVRRYTWAPERALREGSRRTLRYADSLGFPAALVFKVFDNGRGDINRGMLRLYDRLAFPVSRVLDTLTHRWLGKNLLALAVKPRV